MEEHSERDDRKIRKLMKQVKTCYPDCYMMEIDIWKIFPATYIVQSGINGCKHSIYNPNGDFGMGFGDSKLEAWERAWKTSQAIMLDKLQS